VPQLWEVAMGWSDTARSAAADQWGRQNAARYAARRRVGWLVATVAVAGLAVAHVWDTSWTGAALRVAVVAAVVVGVLVALALLVVAGRSGWAGRTSSYRVRVPRKYR
jgi:hypothetical protein